MLKLLSGCLMIFTATLCNAQNFKYEVLNEDNYSLSDNVTPAKNGFLHFEVSLNKKVVFAGIGLNKLRMGVKVNKLDNALKLINSKDLLNGEKKLLPGLYQFFKFKNNHCIAYQDVKDDEKLGNIKIATIDEESITVKSETTIMDFDKNKVQFDIKRVIKKDIDTYTIQFSQSENKLLVITQPEIGDGDRKLVYLNVFDENLKLQMERKIVFKEEMVRISSFLCDDDGNVYIAYWAGEESGERIKKGDVLDEPKKIMIITAENKEPVITSFKLEGFTINYMGLVYSPQQKKVHVLGAYSRGWDENHVGIFNASLDKATMKVSRINNTDFTAELVKKFDEDGYANSKEKKFGLSRYFIPSYIVRGDGTVDFIMYYNQEKTTRSTNNNGAMTITTTFYGGNFLDAHIVNDKVILSRIPRDMTSPGTSVYLNFTSFSNDDKLVLFYNENEKNIEKSIDENPRNGIVQKSEICATTISKDGSVKRELLLKGYDSKSVGLLNRIYPITSNSFFVLLQKLNFAAMSTGDTKYARVTVD